MFCVSPSPGTEPKSGFGDAPVQRTYETERARGVWLGLALLKIVWVSTGMGLGCVLPT